MERYESCRYHRPLPTNGEGNEAYYCLKYTRYLKSCLWCPTCPVCGGKMGLETSMMVTDAKHEYMTCTLCGFHSKGVTTGFEPGKDNMMCDVEGCIRRKNPDCEHQGYTICSQHYDQMETWKARKFPDERFPLLIINHKLVENPRYKASSAPKGHTIPVQICPRCGKTKSINEFYKTVKAPEDQRSKLCRECEIETGSYQLWPSRYQHAKLPKEKLIADYQCATCGEVQTILQSYREYRTLKCTQCNGYRKFNRVIPAEVLNV